MASNLTTQSLVKAHLGVNTTTFDEVIDTIVSGVNQGVENMLNTTFASTTYTEEEYDMDRPSRFLELKHVPVITFTDLQYKDAPFDEDDDNWTSFDTDEYKVDLGPGIITKNTKFRRGKQRYRATYTAGYASVPDDVTLAATKIAASMFQNRKNNGVESETLGQYSRTFSSDRATWNNLDLEFLLDKYKGLQVAWFDDAFMEDPRPTSLNPIP